MHHRNPYNQGINFRSLAEKYPQLQEYLRSTPNGTNIDFKDEAAQRCLTKAILFCDFGIRLNLPDNRLCPPVPNRLNYILWLEDILNYRTEREHSLSTVQGFDIGTGASAIYPLLGTSKGRNWNFLASEIDADSLTYAQRNLRENSLESRVLLLPSTMRNSLFFPLDERPELRLDFTMCNPPFYSSQEEVAASAAGKLHEANAVCTGAPVEMITQGGETAFLGRMVTESLTHRDRCRWYTSMLGKLSSVSEIVELLRFHTIQNYAITEFVQGKTRRWAIGWSFTDEWLPDSLSRISNPLLQQYMPQRNTLQCRIHSELDAERTKLVKEITTMHGVQVIDALNLEEGSFMLQIEANEEGWTRAARRQRLREGMAQNISQKPSIMALTIRLRKDGSDDILIEFQRRRGVQRTVFDSFCSHIMRKMQ